MHGFITFSQWTSPWLHPDRRDLQNWIWLLHFLCCFITFSQWPSSGLHPDRRDLERRETESASTSDYSLHWEACQFQSYLKIEENNLVRKKFMTFCSSVLSNARAHLPSSLSDRIGRLRPFRSLCQVGQKNFNNGTLRQFWDNFWTTSTILG